MALLTDLRAAFDKEYRGASKDAKLLLAIAVGATAAVTASSYDVAKLHPLVDWVGLVSLPLCVCCMRYLRCRVAKMWSTDDI